MIADEEEPFRPRPRLHVRVRRVKCILKRHGPRIAATLLVLAVTVLALGKCMDTIRATGGLELEVGGRGSGDPVGSGGRAILWFLVATGAAALLPKAVDFDPDRRALFKRGALRRELRMAWAALRARFRRAT